MVSDLHNLLQTMRDIYNRNTLSCQLSHNLKKDLYLLLAQRRRRLIHNKNLKIICNQVSGNLDHLLLAYTKFSYLCIRIYFMLQSFENFLGCLNM